MSSALLVRLRPTGPWRFGPGDGGRNRLDSLFRSDRLYSAVTLAMQKLGLLEPWLAATARAEKPAIAWSSLFPFQADTLFVTPPAHLWPPPAGYLAASSPVFLAKIKWQAAQFVPLALAESLLAGNTLLADQWTPDPESGCLLRRDRPQASPFRLTLRSGTAVDRVTAGSVEVHAAACMEFQAGSGMWGVIRFDTAEASAEWQDPIKAAFRLLADSGFGGRRSLGWGHAAEPEFTSGAWPELILPKLARMQAVSTTDRHWLLSLYAPAPQDQVDWASGHYSLATRGGRVDSNGAEKKQMRLVAEGSVLSAGIAPVGVATDVAPEGFDHPVYRAGFALSIAIPNVKEPEIKEESVADQPTEPAPEENQAASISAPVLSTDVLIEQASAEQDDTAKKTVEAFEVVAAPEQTVDEAQPDVPAGEPAPEQQAEQSPRKHPEGDGADHEI